MLQVRFSRPESEQARQRRIQSYEFLQKKQAEEPWVHLQYHSAKVGGALVLQWLQTFCLCVNLSVRVTSSEYHEQAESLPPLSTRLLTFCWCRMVVQSTNVSTCSASQRMPPRTLSWSKLQSELEN